MHGDFKSGNIFLGSGGRVGMIDFQWAGWGLGATDVAYCIAGCAAPDVLDGEGAKERELLKVYAKAREELKHTPG
jgi:aminoglycoside phosphotransferase (APT) family kinase protein